jgi:hypothetical protein
MHIKEAPVIITNKAGCLIAEHLGDLTRTRVTAQWE